MPDLVEPTEHDIQNGWTAESLTEYLESRENVANGIVMFDPEFRPVKLPRRANGKYNPLRWRG